MLKFDVLVIGSGGSGMRAAWAASRHGDLKVALMTKTFPTRSATCMAQGGINGVMKFADPADKVADHIFDTIKGGDYLGDQDAITFYCERLPACINELDYQGVPFNRDGKGQISQRHSGGQNSPRTCYSSDMSGHSLLHTAFEQCLKQNMTILSDWLLLDLVVDQGELCGIVTLDIKTGKINPISAKTVVIATGGAGRLYWMRTSNPLTSTGDGMAACFRAGIPLKDMEMFQFHPTGLSGSGILMSEVSRSLGGYLLNKDGERFMKRYAPEKMELATRDLISQAIETEIREGRGLGEGIDAYVYLDLRHIGREKILESLGGTRDMAIIFEHIDPIDAPIPIRPTAHYTMGGIDIVDYRNGATSIKGIFACGEAACVSIHGANRLGGNSLADAMLFGKVAGEGASIYAQERTFTGEQLVAVTAKDWEKKYQTITERKKGPTVPDIRQRMAETMWYKVGVFRNEKEMLEALETIEFLLQEYQNCVVGDRSRVFNTAFVNYFELGNLLTVAKAVVIGALTRTETRGCHLREDYPQRDDENFLKHTLISKEGAAYKISYRPVAVTKYKPQERRY
ncbi:MAG: FAD-binding protein [Peptococcaceae bacterium]